MDSIEIRKDALLKKLKENLQTHSATYERAVEEFRLQQTELLEELVERARTGKPIDRMALYKMAVPEDHTDDYKLAIEMLELEERDVIELDTYNFRRYYRDEWEWRQQWHANTEAYSLANAKRK